MYLLQSVELELVDLGQDDFGVVLLHEVEDLLGLDVHLFFKLVDCLDLWNCFCTLAVVL
jgi:hypothetical protein